MYEYLFRFDVYSGDPIIHKDVRYEQACILFNLGGLYSQLGANEERRTDEVSLNLALCLLFEFMMTFCFC